MFGLSPFGVVTPSPPHGMGYFLKRVAWPPSYCVPMQLCRVQWIKLQTCFSAGGMAWSTSVCEGEIPSCIPCVWEVAVDSHLLTGGSWLEQYALLLNPMCKFTWGEVLPYTFLKPVIWAVCQAGPSVKSREGLFYWAWWDIGCFFSATENSSVLYGMENTSPTHSHLNIVF